MKRSLILLLAAICAGLLFSCAAQPSEEDGLKLWFLSSPGRGKLPAAFDDWSYEGEETVPALMTALLDGPPVESGLVRAVPVGTQLLDWSVAGRVAHVELSDSYADLTGLDLTLADYSIVLTLTQIDGVDGVRIVVNGATAAFRDRQVLYAGDVIFSGAEEEPVEVYAALYFLREDTGNLGFELREFRLTEDEPPAQAVLEALAAGPQEDGLSALLPEGTAVRSALVDSGLCHADFSAELLSVIPDDPERQELVLSSIVESLCSLEQVEQVQLLVEGEPLEQYGSVNLPGTLYPAADG